MAMLGSAGTIAGRPVMMGAYRYGLGKSESAHGLPYGLSVVSSPHDFAVKGVQAKLCQLLYLCALVFCL